MWKILASDHGIALNLSEKLLNTFQVNDDTKLCVNWESGLLVSTILKKFVY